MKCPCLYGGMLAAVLSLGAPLRAQLVSLPGGLAPTVPILQQTFTTGMVGFTANQTARLNVLNLNAVPSSTTTTTPTPANCTVELQFFDNKGALVQQSVVPNFAPGQATSYDLSRSSLTSETALHAEIRGVVVVNPSPTPVASPAAVGFCSVMTTLEIFDATTGSTVALTSDTRAIGTVLIGVVSPALK